VAGRLRLIGRRLGRPGVAWIVLALLAAGGSLGVAAAPDAWRPSLIWQASHAGQPWRWVTAAWVHLNLAHLAANLAGAVVVAVFGWAARLPFAAALAWIAAWPATQAALVLHPGLHAYAGLSGVLHAGVAVAAVWLLLRGAAGLAPHVRWIGLGVLAGLVLKLGLEQPWGPALRPLPGWDFDVAPVAHAAGAVIGAGLGLLAAAVSPRRSGRDPWAPTIQR
jgi:rhomboid family GlyGly-CTERM serine protease